MWTTAAETPIAAYPVGEKWLFGGQIDAGTHLSRSRQHDFGYCGSPSMMKTFDLAAFCRSGIRSAYGDVLYHFSASARLSNASMT